MEGASSRAKFQEDESSSVGEKTIDDLLDLGTFIAAITDDPLAVDDESEGDGIDMKITIPDGRPISARRPAGSFFE